MSALCEIDAPATAGDTMPQNWAEYLRFRPLFAEALDPRLYAIEHLDALVIGGDARFWSNAGGAIIAEIRRYPTGACTVHGLIAAGDLHAITALIPIAEQWGRDCSCIAAVIESRPAWARALRSKGYGTHQVALWKNLGGDDGA